MTPLQIPTPGGLELIVVLIIFAVQILVIGAVIVGVVHLARRFGGGSDRAEELEARVEQVEAENEELEAELDSRR
jgi:outer membrane murein-binding lipoprotein Lpp